MKKWVKDLKNQDCVLDLGCGEGRILQDVKVNIDYTGIDFSRKLIAIAKTKYGNKNYKFIVGDLKNDRVWKKLGKFDKIFLSAVLHHFGEEREQLDLLKKVKKHLKTGGIVYFSVWNLWQKKFYGEHWRSLRLKLLKLPTSLRWVNIPFRQTNLKRFYFAGGKKYWQNLLKKTGFKNTKVFLGKNKQNICATLS